MEKETPLSIAAASSQSEIRSLCSLDNLMNNLECLNCVDSNGKSPLFHAVNSGDLYSVKRMLEKGANFYNYAILLLLYYCNFLYLNKVYSAISFPQ